MFNSNALAKLAAATLIALALAGCGRKGGLDLPPSAATNPNAAIAASESEIAEAEREAAAASVFNPNPRDQVVAGKGRKRPFILDPLLD